MSSSEDSMSKVSFSASLESVQLCSHFFQSSALWSGSLPNRMMLKMESYTNNIMISKAKLRTSSFCHDLFLSFLFFFFSLSPESEIAGDFQVVFQIYPQGLQYSPLGATAQEAARSGRSGLFAFCLDHRHPALRQDRRSTGDQWLREAVEESLRHHYSSFVPRCLLPTENILHRVLHSHFDSSLRRLNVNVLRPGFAAQGMVSNGRAVGPRGDRDHRVHLPDLYCRLPLAAWPSESVDLPQATALGTCWWRS